VRHYHGIDLAGPAINLAATKLAHESYDVDLDHRDFVEAMAARPEPADAVWCGLSLHHLPTDEKLRLIREVRGVTSDRGVFLIYEPTLSGGEDRKAYLDRTWRIIPERWATLTPAELEQIWHHIQSSDLPESADTWLDLGRKAGFSHAGPLFTDPTDLYRMFRYQA
jgi:SAM-dependent methyltransferase